MKKNICLVFLFLGLSTACSRKYKTHDPLLTYWQVKYNKKNHNSINKRFQGKLSQIDEQVQKLKQKDWANNIHGIYCQIQSIRNKKIEPLKTLNKDDI